MPVAVTSARCWPPRAFVKSPGVIDVSFGPPIDSQGRKADELMRQVQEWIEAEMRRLDAPAYGSAGAIGHAAENTAGNATESTTENTAEARKA